MQNLISFVIYSTRKRGKTYFVCLLSGARNCAPSVKRPVNVSDLFYESEVILQITLTITELHVTLTKFFNWFDNNHMKANPGKCHLLFNFKTFRVLYIGETTISCSTA